MGALPNAVILAAGAGSRLAGATSLPKPLVPIAGVPLLRRAIRTLAAAGVRDVHVVVGNRAEEVVTALRTWPEAAGVRTLPNPLWESQLGLSVLAARGVVMQGTFLTMTDHLFGVDVARRLIDAPLGERALLLAVDRRVDAVFDLPDATKVRTRGARIAAIGKDLEDYDAIDTGLFRVGPALVEALSDVARERGDASLSDGVSALARRGLAEVVDVSGGAWLDVDTPDALAEAERQVTEGRFG